MKRQRSMLLETSSGYLARCASYAASTSPYIEVCPRFTRSAKRVWVPGEKSASMSMGASATARPAMKHKKRRSDLVVLVVTPGMLLARTGVWHAAIRARLFVQLEAAADQRPGALAGAGDLVQLVFGGGDHAVAAAALGQVQRLVGLPECVLETLVGMRDGHAEAGRDRQRILRDEVRLHDLVAQLLGQIRGLRQVRTGADQHELLAAPAAQPIGVARVRAQDFAHGAQHAIATVVAALVVDALEVIEVDHDDAGVHARGLQVFDEPLDAVPIQHIGERVE